MFTLLKPLPPMIFSKAAIDPNKSANNPVIAVSPTVNLSESIKDNVSEKVKLQDALIVLNKINASMDLVFLVKERLKKYTNK